MKFTMRLLANVGLPLLAILSISSVSAQTSVGKTILEKLTAKVTKLESACAKDIKKYCKDGDARRGPNDLLHAGS